MIEVLSKIKLNSELLDEKSMVKYFNMAFKNLKKTFIKLEAKQYYKCDMDVNYYNYIDGNHKYLINTFKEFYNDWPSLLETKRNIKFKRLHLITKPITNYINYEMYFYLMNEKAGENIKLLDFKNNIDEIDDFMIFDDNEIIINCHDLNGEYLKSYYYNGDKKLIRDLTKKYNELYERGSNYKEYIEFDNSILDEMNKYNLI